MRYALNQGVLFSLPFEIGLVRCFSAGHYADRVLQRLLQLYKYEQVEEAGEILLEIFLHAVGRQTSAILAGLDNPVVVPVPMHPINYSRRGFNQAEVLARYLAADFELELDKKTLCRRFSWRPQARVFNTEQRVKNVSRVFFAKNNSLFGREILLVDDVFTTGATITDCLRALQLEESNKITIITMLKG
jgi:ComF family protein